MRGVCKTEQPELNKETQRNGQECNWSEHRKSLLSERISAIETNGIRPRIRLAANGAHNVCDTCGACSAADGCRFAPFGVATLICGPGEFAEAHQPNESISRRAFEEGADVVRAVVERLCCV